MVQVQGQCTYILICVYVHTSMYDPCIIRYILGDIMAVDRLDQDHQLTVGLHTEFSMLWVSSSYVHAVYDSGQ